MQYSDIAGETGVAVAFNDALDFFEKSDGGKVVAECDFTVNIPRGDDDIEEEFTLQWILINETLVTIAKLVDASWVDCQFAYFGHFNAKIAHDMLRYNENNYTD